MCTCFSFGYRVYSDSREFGSEMAKRGAVIYITPEWFQVRWRHGLCLSPAGRDEGNPPNNQLSERGNWPELGFTFEARSCRWRRHLINDGRGGTAISAGSFSLTFQKQIKRRKTSFYVMELETVKWRLFQFVLCVFLIYNPFYTHNFIYVQMHHLMSDIIIIIQSV